MFVSYRVNPNPTSKISGTLERTKDLGGQQSLDTNSLAAIYKGVGP